MSNLAMHSFAAALSPQKEASLLGRARLLQRAALDGAVPPRLLRGKNLGLLSEAGDGEALALLRQAAEELGAQVATMRSSLSLATPVQELQHTARMLGRLYDAVACEGIDAALVRQIGQHAGIPVHDGAAADSHPTAALAGLLGERTAAADNRRFVLQALLIESIG